MSDVKDTDANAAASPEDVGPLPCPGIRWWGLSLAVSLPGPSAPLCDEPLLGSGVAANRKTAQQMRWRARILKPPFGTLTSPIVEKPRCLMTGQEGAGTEMALGVWADHLKRGMNRLGTQAWREPLLAGSTHHVVRAKKTPRRSERFL